MIATDTKTKLTGILGNPVGHSLSPKLHSYLAKETGIDTAYLAFCIEREDIKSVLDGAKCMGVQGFNVTSPFKTDVLPFLDEIDTAAQTIGSVNTVVNKNGKWIGYNTDGAGFIKNLERHGVLARNKHVLLIGSGGTARTLTYQFAQNGAGSVTVSSRKVETAAQLAPLVSDFPQTIFLDRLNANQHYDIVVNCTPFGMEPYADKNPMPEGLCMQPDMVFCDLIYNPAKTLFLQQAEEKGALAINGLGMLLFQGVLAFERFFDVTVPDDVVKGLFTLFEQEAKR